ncbi:MAG: DegT/DnrJ/EryC1/StrS family aminotransferase [Myxococcota bacterium]
MQGDEKVIAITGGAGFIGAALTRRLLEAGHRVRCLDTGSFHRLDDLRGHPRLERLEGDVLDEAAVRDLVTSADVVAHLAASVGVKRYVEDPEHVLDMNILGTRRVLRACTDLGRPAVFSSTSEVLGKGRGRLHPESDRVYGPSSYARWSYAVSKSAGEHYAHALRRRGLRVAILRYFNVYGPEMDRPGEGRVISRFVGDLLDGRPLTLVDGGEAVRAFCYVDDAIEATTAAVLRIGDDPRLDGATLHIGRDEPVSIRDLAERMLAITGSGVGTRTVPGEAFLGEGFEEIPRRVPDLEASRDLLGYEAPTGLDEGLRRVLRRWNLPDDGPTPSPPPLPVVRPDVEPDGRLGDHLFDILVSGRLTNQGPELQRFEAELADWLGAPRVVLTSSGSAALELTLAAMTPGPGKAVLPSFTYAATLNAVLASGLEPLLCDVSPDTWTLSPEHLERLLEDHDDVRVVLPVNTFGVPPDLGALGERCAAHGARMLYDNAQGLGTEVRGRRWDDRAALQIVSLHATKVLPAVEGGALVTADHTLADDVAQRLQHGLAEGRLHHRPGTNAKMSELHAAVGRHALAGLGEALARRRGYAQRLRAAVQDRCAGIYGVQRVPEGVISNFQDLGVTCPAAAGGRIEAWGRELEASGVESRRYFWPPLHRLLSLDGAGLPETGRLDETLLTVPLHNRMTDEEVSRVERALATASEAVRSWEA